MAVACASRFAVLKLEDDDLSDPSTVSSPNQNLKESNSKTKSKPGDVKSTSSGVTDVKTKPKKKKKNSSNDVAELQNLAFGNGVSKNKTKGGNQSQSSGNQRAPSEKQWEEWKKKDSEFVSETYEQDLQQALLLSRIDYEEKKDVYEAIQKESENKQTNQQKKKKKGSQKKEKGTMSLDEFQNLHPSEIESGSYLKSSNAAMDDFEIQEKTAPPVDESDFFDKIEEDAGKIISREHRQESFKKLSLSTKPKPESARDLQYQDELEKRDLEIKSLTETVQKLQDELKVVKTRNKKLCSILATGEMREKAEILVQIEQLTSVKDELTEQVSELHAALEQERSKVHTLQTELKKCHNNRKDRRDSK